jgi:hypothetical protein
MGQQRHFRKVAFSSELIVAGVPFDTHPVVEGLKGEVGIFGGLEFENREAPVAAGGEQVNHATVAAGEGGHLTVERMREQPGVEFVDVSANGAFEPGLRVAAVEGMLRVSRRWRADAGDPFGEGCEFAGIGDGAPAIDARFQVPIMVDSESEATNAKGKGSVVGWHSFDVRQLPDEAELGWEVVRGAAN